MNPLTLGLLTFTAEHSPGDGVFVTVSDDSGKLCLTLQQWSSLCTVVEVLDLVDKRHETDRLEISRLDTLVAELRDKLAKWETIAEATHGQRIEQGIARQIADWLSQNADDIHVTPENASAYLHEAADGILNGAWRRQP